MLATTSLPAPTCAFWNAHSGGSQLTFKKSLLPYDHHVLFQANHMEKLFRKRNTRPTLAVSGIPAEMPDMGVKKAFWTSSLDEPSDDSIPSYHFNVTTEDPKQELPSQNRSVREKIS